MKVFINNNFFKKNSLKIKKIIKFFFNNNILSFTQYANFIKPLNEIIHDKDYFITPYVEDFPVLATTDSGETYLAVLERFKTRSQIGVFKVLNEKRIRIASLSVKGSLGLSQPSIIGLKNEVLVSFMGQIKNVYDEIYYVKINQSGKKSKLNKIVIRGVTNILPKFSRNENKICLVWESNYKGTRNIFQSWIDENLVYSNPVMISSHQYNNCNPDIIALKHGGFFVAWDSFRNGRSNIYGTFFRNEKWEKEFKITYGTWIEKHVALAYDKNDIWLSWQAQRYRGSAILKNLSQKIFTAKLTDDRKLLSPVSDFDVGISKMGKSGVIDAGRHIRPRIYFTPSGKLILTSRHSAEFRGGWYPVMWIYNGKSWGPMKTIYNCQGRWRPISISFGKNVAWIATQIDNIPGNFGIDYGDFPAWKSEVQLISLEMDETKPLLPFNLKQFTYPKSNFDTKKRFIKTNANQKRQEIKFAGRKLKLYYGNLHTHSSFSVCKRVTNLPADDLFGIERDLSKMDFLSITDHGYNLDYFIWRNIREIVSMYHDPTRFITFLGQEWTSQEVKPQKKMSSSFNMPLMNRFGHSIIIYENPFYQKFYDSRDADISPADVAKDIGKNENFMIIPHQLADWKHKGQGNPPTDWDVIDEVCNPLAEIYQARGSYEYLGAPKQAKDSAPFRGLYLQDAWEKGIIIGTMASSDHAGGHGITGVWAEELTRKSLFNAFRARHTYGTTCEKIALFFSSGKYMMGDKVERPDNIPIEFNIRINAHDELNEIVIFRNNKIVYKNNPQKKDINVLWKDIDVPKEERLWYYLRLQTKKGSFAWSSPIWFFKKMPSDKKFKNDHYTENKNIGHLYGHGESNKEYKVKKIKHGEMGYTKK